MEFNLFSSQQIEYMYSDKEFLEFINQYFSTYSTNSQDINYSINADEWDDSDTDIYLRILLANLENLHQYISELERSMTFSYSKTEKIFAGEIKGRLNVNKYIQSKGKVKAPKEYPCTIKEKTALSPENVFVIYIIDYVLRTLNMLKKYMKRMYSSQTKYSELIILENHFRAFNTFCYKPYFKECEPILKSYRRIFGDTFPVSEYNVITKRMKKGKIRNASSYNKIFEWFMMFKKGSILFVGNSTMEILRYSEDFSNKLFELWCLYSIKKTFIEEFNAKLVLDNNIMKAGENCIFKLEGASGGEIAIYYQKGSDLYWKNDSDLVWMYKREGREKGLRGIPDISIIYKTDKEALVMIDIKNRNRSGGSNSEEIYKMIGYYGNFRNRFESEYSKDVKKHAALLFRNDYLSFSEELNSNEGYSLMTYSVTPSEKRELNADQFKLLCRYILDVQGIDGSTSEIMGNYSRLVHKDNETVEVDPEMRLYDISNQNHYVISKMFSFGDLAEELPKKKEQLKWNHFPHVWDLMEEKTKDILGMADCLYDGLTISDHADYAPICLEYCRALEVQLNMQIFNPFRESHNINQLFSRNRFYEKLKENREITLGECIYILDKCTHRNYPTIELRNYVSNCVIKYELLFRDSIGELRRINEDIRRKSAHTSVMTYDELQETRQRILGIGNLNLFYVLLDNR